MQWRGLVIHVGYCYLMARPTQNTFEMWSDLVGVSVALISTKVWWEHYKDSLISMWHFNGTQFHPVLELKLNGRKQNALSYFKMFKLVITKIIRVSLIIEYAPVMVNMALRKSYKWLKELSGLIRMMHCLYLWSNKPIDLED